MVRARRRCDARVRPIDPHDLDLCVTIHAELDRLPERLPRPDRALRPGGALARRGRAAARLAAGDGQEPAQPRPGTLRDRLVRRGVAPLALGAILAEGRTGGRPRCSGGSHHPRRRGGAASASAIALAGPVARSLVMSTVKNVAGVFLVASIMLGVGLAAPIGCSPSRRAPYRPPARSTVRPPIAAADAQG